MSESPISVGVLRVVLRLQSRTLKEKRTVVKSVVERLRNRFNAAVAEGGDLDKAGSTEIVVAVVSNEGAHADRQLQAIAAAIEDWRLDAEVVDIATEVLAL